MVSLLPLNVIPNKTPKSETLMFYLKLQLSKLKPLLLLELRSITKGLTRNNSSFIIVLIFLAASMNSYGDRSGLTASYISSFCLWQACMETLAKFVQKSKSIPKRRVCLCKLCLSKIKQESFWQRSERGKCKAL